MENRLSSATNTTGGTNLSFVYDGDGQMVQRTVNGQTTHYLGKLYHQTPSSGPSVKHYTFNGQLVVRLWDNVSLRYRLSDHLGSATTELNYAGAKTADVRYEPWGTERWVQTALSVPYFFTSQRWDSELGLYDYQARYYDAKIGRFISADPLIPNPANPQAFSRYSYVLNSPIRYTDPTGHYVFEEDPGEPYFDPPEPEPSSTLPSGEPPSGLDEYGQAAWEGLQAINANKNQWWGEELDAHEAMTMFLNHEFGNLCNLNQGGSTCLPQAVVDAVVNRYNEFCSAGAWSTSCIDDFWGYSQVLREPNVNLIATRAGRDRDIIAELERTAYSILTGNTLPESQAFHWGNNFDDNTSSTTFTNWQNGEQLYVYWVYPYYYPDSHPLRGRITSIFAVQTSDQHDRTGRLDLWRR